MIQVKIFKDTNHEILTVKVNDWLDDIGIDSNNVTSVHYQTTDNVYSVMIVYED